MKKRIFEYQNYKEYVQERIAAMPKGGRGQWAKVAKHLGVNSVQVSHIFKGDRELTPEQSLEICEYFGLSELETDYFEQLVLKERAGTHKLKTRVITRLQALQKEGMKAKTRVSKTIELSGEAKAVYYSNWSYAAVRLLTFINKYDNIDPIANRLGLPRGQIRQIIEFLVQEGLILDNDNQLEPGEAFTYLDRDSPLIKQLHTNWRLKAFERMDKQEKDVEFFFTFPMATSEAIIREVRGKLLELVESLSNQMKDEYAEDLACLNIDWFRIEPDR